jgi:hypothetical protein
MIGRLIGLAAVVILLFGGMWLFIAPSFQGKTTKRRSGRSVADDASSAAALQQDAEVHHSHLGDHGNS